MLHNQRTDLIYRNDALEQICMYCCAGKKDDCPEGRCVDYQIISNLPKVEAVEVVRCKDCKRKTNGLCPMETPWHITDDNSFCSYGERRTDGNL